ncbi:MAG TPA: dienelactone hydrolase family protein [Bryobacteraceae bacterium]|jgi:carboxymethylenebutenolidase|nr:dienelactone hydrolase family protein [Bryobacteraceae bacterium]
MTPNPPIEDADVHIPTRDIDIPAYQALPAAPGPFPIVLIAPEIFGVNEHIRSVARRFASEGYYAIAPDLFIRQGDVSKLTDSQEIQQIIAKVPDMQVMSDLTAAAEFASASGRGNIERLLMTGFCWGGRIAWLYAAENSHLRAAVAWYGRLTAPLDALRERHPLNITDDLKCPVLGLYGGQDKSIPLEHVERMRAEIARSQRNSNIHVYPDAGHAFFADYRPSYNAAAAEDGWQRLQRWFGQAIGR